MAVNVAEFENWLCKKLADLEIDADVYGSYITGILNEDDDSESKHEALEGILGSLVEDPECLCKQVLEKWKPLQTSEGGKMEERASTIEDILAAHSAKVTQNSAERPTAEQTDSAMKRALLEKYSEVYEEVDENEASAHKTQTKSIAPVTLGLFQNVNIKAVTDAEKQKRDKQKEDFQKKKEKDKLDREKQKQKKEERKEKEKKRTQKKERSGR